MCLEANGDLSELTDRDESWSGLKPIKDRNLGRLTNHFLLRFHWLVTILGSDWTNQIGGERHLFSITLKAILVNQMLLTQFIEYIQLYKNFETSYDQILQPQKRLVIRRLLEATMGRMIELKHELVKHQLNYIQFHEPVLKVKQGRYTTRAVSLRCRGSMASASS